MGFYSNDLPVRWKEMDLRLNGSTPEWKIPTNDSGYIIPSVAKTVKFSCDGPSLFLKLSDLYLCLFILQS
jgi:hypothetical protein